MTAGGAPATPPRTPNSPVIAHGWRLTPPARRAPGLAVLAVAAAVAACGGGSSSGPSATAKGGPPVPPRAITAGDALLGLVPAGADLVVEVDLARLRANAVVGGAIRALIGAPGAEASAGAAALRGLEGGALGAAASALTAGPLADADVILLASYDVGTAEAATVTVVRGAAAPGLERSVGAALLRDDVAAIAPPSLRARVEAVAAGSGTPLAADRDLLVVRAAAMPEKADGAAVRAAIRLGFDARVALASTLGLDTVPAAVSVWGDVADDAAVVALADAGAGEGSALADVVRAAQDELTRSPPLAGWRPGLLARRIAIARDGDRVRIVATLTPRLLAMLASRVEAALAPPPRPPEPPAPAPGPALPPGAPGDREEGP